MEYLLEYPSMSLSSEFKYFCPRYLMLMGKIIKGGVNIVGKHKVVLFVSEAFSRYFWVHQRILTFSK